MSNKNRTPRAWATLTVDLILEIVSRSDVTTVVRSAATCRIVRAAILTPYFRQLVLQVAADGGGFDPSGLVLGVTYNDSKITTQRVIHIPDHPSRRRVLLDTASIQQCFQPLAARDGLFLLRHRHELLLALPPSACASATPSLATSPTYLLPPCWTWRTQTSCSASATTKGAPSGCTSWTMQ